ncbi:hypothetical protein BJF79_38400 [Actinomadura sp. CNU-125]|nr:hypothetical protein BJF79_38400 [Actinomadura sp. CNU-125]
MPVPCISAPNVSQAWLEAVRALDRKGSDPRALHMVVSIDDPTTEEEPIRAAVDMLLRDLDLPPADTVANTIFPAALAATCADHDELVERYLKYLPRLLKFKGNHLGTYFARLIDYPGPKGPVDQLGAAIARMQKGGRARFTRYEALVDQPMPHTPETMKDKATENEAMGKEFVDPGSAPVEAFSPIYVPGKDNTPGSFPCMSHCSFQLDAAGKVHALAYYRSQSMVQRAYGNYLGLGRLLDHVVGQAGLETGRLTIVAGQAQIEEPFRRRAGLVAAQPETLPGLAL